MKSREKLGARTDSRQPFSQTPLLQDMAVLCQIFHLRSPVLRQGEINPRRIWTADTAPRMTAYPTDSLLTSAKRLCLLQTHGP